MLKPNTLLQNRYRVLRRIGGGGMGIVYLAADTRLAGRNCAIKEMSPAQLATQDRNWAINAFRQEAQILARLSHPGLTTVTDFFPESGNWYLLMDYVEGKTLQERLDQARGGRLPLEEALGIVRQLCNVLEYLHGQSPPVVFRDLKPGNVMLTPRGEVKLIDFGIARFFKPGRTRDTVNLGTPGYAAPEQFGGRGQSGPQTDIYSLGVLLHQMVTGYDPTTADTPFPLPDPGSLVHGLPQHVEEAISRAIRLQPDLRFQSVQELQRVLFPPTWVLPPQPPGPQSQRSSSSGLGKGIGLGVVGVLLLGLCVAAIAGGLALVRSPDGEVTVISPAASSATRTPVAVDTSTPSAIAPVTASPATPADTVTPTQPRTISSRWADIGQSVQGRDLSMAIIGDEKGSAIVIVGSIQGEQTNTRDLANALINHFDQNRQQIPENVTFYLMLSLNPDGNVLKSRYNADGVDLNRNWDTSDWRSNAAVPDYPNGKPGAGGSSPFSEPEARALRDFLLGLKHQAQDVRVVIFHSSVHRTQGEVYPGGNDAIDVAYRYVSVTGYDVESDWAEYTTSGELVTWCDEQGIISIDVVIPGSQSPSSRISGTTLLDITVRALLNITDFQ